jgi:hypothetical protein
MKTSPLSHESRFCRTAAPLAAALVLAAGCLGLDSSTSEHAIAATEDEPKQEEPLKPRMEVCDRELVVSEGKQSRALLYCATDDVHQGTQAPKLLPGYRRLVVTQHGRGGNARWYFNTTADLAKDYRGVFVIAPQLINLDEVLEKYSSAAGFVPGWHFEWKNMWPLGSLSIGGATDLRRTSYELLDQLIAAAIVRLPDLQEVVIVGQSAGGQLVNRYGATNQLSYPVGVRIRYIPMNPQSWLYLDDDRPYPELAEPEQGDIFNPNPEEFDFVAACPEYDDYYTGLQKLDSWPYFESKGITAHTVRSQLKTRWMIKMVGELDTEDPDDGKFNCRFRVQGLNRNERAKAYHDHVTGFYVPLAVNNYLFEVPGATHGHLKMYKSDCGRRWIFDDLSKPCL